MEFAGNIYSLFCSQVAKYGDREVFFTRNQGRWISQTWIDFDAQVHDVACALAASGLSKSGSVAILAGNVPEWPIIDIAAIAAGGVGVGIYPTSSAEQCEFIVRDSDAEFLFVDSLNQLQKFLVSDKLPTQLARIILLEMLDERQLDTVSKAFADRGIELISFKDFVDFGRMNRPNFLNEIRDIGRNAQPSDIAIMVYTSGTTGEPKGAMLSHAYVLNSLESLRQSVPIFDSDVAFSYLPACHVAERIAGIYNRLYNGSTTYFVDDISRLPEYIMEVRPTVFASLPRFFEKIHAALVATQNMPIDAAKVRDAFGGRIRLLTSGGAPLPNEIAKFFADAGVPILQAYGLTENICVAFNTVENLKFGTVGKPMPMCLVRLSCESEILVKSPMMFSGYYKQPAKTGEMFTDDGWLKTGDIGEIDDDGFLKITGRIKELIVLSTGKNVAPSLLENYVKEDYLISNCFVFGDGRKYCTALITLNQNEAAVDGRYAEFIASDAIRSRVSEIVTAANERVSSSEQIKKWIIPTRDFSLELNELTPTGKLKRSVIEKNFKQILESLYEN